MTSTRAVDLQDTAPVLAPVLAPLPAPAAAEKTARLSAGVLGLLVLVSLAAPFPGSGPVVFGVSLLAVAHLSWSGPLAWPGWALTGFLLWAACSVAWSVDPSETLRGTLITSASTLSVCFAVRQLSPQAVLGALARALQVLIVLSWLLFLTVPSIGREQVEYHQGALSGIFVQRNAAAFVLGLAVLVFLQQALSQRAGRRLAALGWALAAAVSLVASESGTGLAVTVLAALLLTSLHVMRSRSGFERSTVLAASAAALGLTVAGAGLLLDAGAALLGRDDSLTGRTVIWAAIEPYARAEPLRGYGWRALWNPGTQVTEQIWEVARFPFSHAHDAYLDLVMQTGLVGLVLVVLALLSTLVGGWRRLVVSGRPVAFALAVAVFLVLYGITEQSLVAYPGWLALVLAWAFTRADPSPPSAGG